MDETVARYEFRAFAHDFGIVEEAIRRRARVARYRESLEVYIMSAGNDENNTTPPERMYPREKIDASCRECHEDHDVPARKVLAVFLERCPHDVEPKSVVCTDCHGQHRLAIRTVRWDKATGKLITGEDEQREKRTGQD